MEAVSSTDYSSYSDCSSGLDSGAVVVQAHVCVLLCRGNYLDGEEEGTVTATSTATGAGETMLGDVERLNGGEEVVGESSNETEIATGTLYHVRGHGHGHPQ